MGIIDSIKQRFNIKDASVLRRESEASFIANQPQAYNDYSYKPYPSYTELWDGEKNWGELGAPINYLADFRSLSIRSWQSYYESDITQMIIRNYLLWVVGKGLNLNSEPIDSYILKFDSTFNRDTYTDDVEDLWQIFANSKKPAYNGMQNLNQIAHECKLNAIVGGDVLVIMRYDGIYPNIELIDGLHIMTPTDSATLSTAKSLGNTIKCGVEIDKKGKHVAFHVRNKDGKFERVAAYHSKTQRPLAWLVYGSKYRIDDTRGMPLFAVVLEELKKLGRYKEAIIASAEEGAKVVYAVETEKGEIASNPLTNAIVNANRSGQGTVPETESSAGDTTATKVATSTKNLAFSLGAGQKLVSFKSEKETNFNDFFTPNFGIICATIGVAPEVVLNKYDSNYSASRMATKMSEFKFSVEREDFAVSFYKPIFGFWLDTRVLLNKINIPGYITALVNADFELLEAYKTCEFTGPNMPHVDPVKEVTAERLKLGKINENVPLTTFTKSTRRLGEGDYNQNIENYKQEAERATDLIIPEQPNIPQNGNTGN